MTLGWASWTFYLAFRPSLTSLLLFSVATCTLITLHRHLADGGELFDAVYLFGALMSQSMLTPRRTEGISASQGEYDTQGGGTTMKSANDGSKKLQ